MHKNVIVINYIANAIEFCNYFIITVVICTITMRGFCLRIQCWFLTSNY